MKIAIWMFLAVLSVSAYAEDTIARARQLATSGDRAGAIAMLETHLQSHPDDLDARTLLGTVLSWDRRFDRARSELRTVIARDPKNIDARTALARVELWSGHPAEAARIAGEALALAPGDADLLGVRAQARAAIAQNEVMIGANYDDFGESDPWREAYVSSKWNLRVPIVGRAAHGRRFGEKDGQFELEAYPRFSATTYAYLAGGFSSNKGLYPDSRFGAEMFRTFPGAWEASLGARRLKFDNAVNVYTASIGKYLGDWLISARAYDAKDTTSVQLIARRYFGAPGQYAGIRVGRGSTRDDIRSASDIHSLDVREVAAEALLVFGRGWLLNVRGGAGRVSHGRGDTASASVAVGVRY